MSLSSGGVRSLCGSIIGLRNFLVSEVAGKRSEEAEADLASQATKWEIMSTGTGKMMVVFFSLPILPKV